MEGRPSVWLVSPAWRRYPVTRLALAQRAHLATVLAARGIDCHTVIVADDENLDIAREHGFAAVEMPNEHGVGGKCNAGLRHAAGEGADWFVWIGSDDWLHPDAFAPILEPAPKRPAIISGRQIAFVDLLTGRMRTVTVPGTNGVIPWIVPRVLLERCGFEPIKPDRNRGLDGYLVRGIRQSRREHVRWRFHDPHPLGRVDFKSDVNINPYAALPGAFARGREQDPWPRLAEHYPPELVEQARRTHLQLQGDPR